MTLACSSSDNNMADLDKRQQKYVTECKKQPSDTIPRLATVKTVYYFKNKQIKR